MIESYTNIYLINMIVDYMRGKFSLEKVFQSNYIKDIKEVT